jgi:hypothetical protein
MNDTREDSDEHHDDELDHWIGDVFEDPVTGECFEDYSAERDWDF